MPTITEGKLSFTFPEDWNVSKYDEWAHYRRHFIKTCASVKAVDILALSPGPERCCWLVEVKDYREHARIKTVDLASEIAEKVRDTLAGLASAQFRAAEEAEKTAARRALRAVDLRIVLHLEQPVKTSKLFPRAINPADVRQDLRRLVRSIDPHPLVVEAASDGFPWEVR